MRAREAVMLNESQPQDAEQEPAATPDSETDVPAAAHELERAATNLRAASAVMLLALALTLSWLYPQTWDALGLTGFVLVSSLLVSSCVFVYLSAQLLVDEPVSEVFRLLMGESLSFRRKARFLNRVQHECAAAKARSRTRTFSIVVIAMREADGTPADQLARIRDAVRPAIRALDVLGEVAPGEVGVLARGAPPQAAESMCERLLTAVATNLHVEPDVLRIGWSSYLADAEDGEGLVDVARSRAQIVEPEDFAAAA